MNSIKHISFLLIFLLVGKTFAQDSTRSIKVNTPKIVNKLDFGKSIHFDDIELKFVEVITDSRCPKNVTCVWAGEVSVLVNVIKNGTFLEQKKLSFGTASYSNRNLLSLISKENFEVRGFSVLPYPVNGNKIKPEEYYIQLEVID